MSLLPALLILLSCADAPEPSDLDGDGHRAVADGGEDCDDRNNQVFPGAAEACNGVDDDCDGAIDEIFDVDGDGFLADDPACLALAGQVDCDDADAAVHPGAAEVCNERDDDCSGVADDIGDADGDGFSACEDCDDTDALVFPGAAELCNGVDDDCNGRADEAWDGDGDGFAPCAGDCDDTDWTAHPDADEICDGADNDCDGELDEGFDADGDGFSTCQGDCADDDPARHPFAEELCNDLDDDCDGEVDDAGDADGDGSSICDDCDDGDPSVFPGAIELCDAKDTDCDGALLDSEADVDGDGVPECGGDCDDEDPLRAPGFAEACDGQDNDCDDSTLETVDNDGDGLTACGGDCDDREPLAYDGAVEVCDAVDNDCDGLRDEDGCAGCEVVEDEDGDFDGHVYLFCDTQRTFEGAWEDCLDRGYDLAAVGSEREEDWLDDESAAVLDSTWWAGFNDLDSEGDWVWTNGEAVTYTNWASGEPNDSSGEDCGQLFWSGTQWNDIRCEATDPYICESVD